ncbi:MAG: sigma 54-interacting transcriptional regulator [Polyangiaceae bacterium]|nr:sigma 54-interacting transcriptional regulator [Polyangiaceae bacterium]
MVLVAKHIEPPIQQRAIEAASQILGSSDPICALRELVARVAPTELAVVIAGETGTGKELVAKALHQGSARTNGRFVAINCGAIPETLVEEELFGHERGAFTGAIATKVGRIVLADRGTLFLDEVADLPPSAQVKLLRVLEERIVEPVGSTRPIRVDVRIVSASHKNLEQEVAKGRFRDDLYYRLRGIRLRVPPLRERGDDILLLAKRFLELGADSYGRSAPSLSPALEATLKTLPWRGNVRELRNEMEKAVVLGGFHDLIGESVEPSLPLLMENLSPVVRTVVRALHGTQNGLSAQELTEHLEREHGTGNTSSRVQDARSALARFGLAISDARRAGRYVLVRRTSQ